ncbi:MAG: ASPIC/UnbV domain-containing protein, partial [Flavobacteriales bacterium]|nr:ASPIC/UnbV domain-containing protein [Flavobacteriales bacterium]
TGFFLQSKFVDMDNDGFLDLMIAGGIERFFRNNGNKTFSAVSNLFPAGDVMHSFATGDLNNDGFQDVFASYGDGYVSADQANPDRLWLNNGNNNHWLTVRLVGVESNIDAIGARVTIEGPWGTQIREVRSGESYGMVTSFACNFGVGANTVIPTVTVRWPSGLVETFTDVAVDQSITVIEGTCISPSVEITTDGEAVLCGAGDQVTLTGNAGFNYTWSTGANTQSISVAEAGIYTLTIDDGSGCSGVSSIAVLDSPDETPTVALTGEAVFCEGGVVELTSSTAAAYAWSNGATTQTVQVSTSGTYTVTIEGNCGEFTSAAIEVEVLEAPDAPTADGVVIPVPGTADLFATGSDVRWYDAASGGNLLGTGNAFTTPVVNDLTSFWVADAITHGGGEAFGGPANRLQTAMPGAFHTNADNFQVFQANEDFTIRSVKVFANGAGNRTIALVDRTTGATLATGVYNIPNGESRVTLNYDVPAGGPYGLRVVGGNPQLWRDGLGSNPSYPYALGTFGSITSSTVTGANATAYFYFFYDWEVEAPSVVCEGPRTEVEVSVGNVGVEAVDGEGFGLWPNPADDQVFVQLPATFGTVDLELMDIAGRIVLSQRVAANTAGPVALPTLGFSAGEYVLHVRHSEGSKALRVVLR